METNQLLVSTGNPTCSNNNCNSGCLPYSCSTGSCTNLECKDTCIDNSQGTFYNPVMAYGIQAKNETAIMYEVLTYGPITVGFSVFQSFMG